MAEAAKRQVIGLIEQMPDDASLDDILYELYFRSKVEAGLADIREDRTVSHEEVMQKVTQWLRSAGQ